MKIMLSKSLKKELKANIKLAKQKHRMETRSIGCLIDELMSHSFHNTRSNILK